MTNEERLVEAGWNDEDGQCWSHSVYTGDMVVEVGAALEIGPRHDAAVADERARCKQVAQAILDDAAAYQRKAVADETARCYREAKAFDPWPVRPHGNGGAATMQQLILRAIDPDRYEEES